MGKKNSAGKNIKISKFKSQVRYSLGTFSLIDLEIFKIKSQPAIMSDRGLALQHIPIYLITALRGK